MGLENTALVRFTIMASQVFLFPLILPGSQSLTSLTLRQARIMETMAALVSWFHKSKRRRLLTLLILIARVTRSINQSRSVTLSFKKVWMVKNIQPRAVRYLKAILPKSQKMLVASCRHLASKVQPTLKIGTMGLKPPLPKLIPRPAWCMLLWNTMEKK